MRFAIVGLGRMGRIHLEAALSQGWSCVAAAEPNISEHSMASLPAGTALFETYGPKISALKPEVVVLSTTTDVRASLLTEVLREDSVQLVITEKPLSSSIADARGVFATAKSLGKRVIANHQMRFTPLYEYIGELVFSGRYGDLVSIHVSAANFGLGNNAVHFIEMALYLFRSSPVEVRGQIDAGPLASHRGAKFRDHSGRLEVRFPNSRILTIEFMNSLGHGIVTILSFSFAKIVVNELTGDVSVIARKTEDLGVETQKYGLEGVIEHHVFGAMDVLAATTSLYAAAQLEDDWLASLRRAVQAVEVSALTVFSSKQNRGLPVPFESAGLTALMSKNHYWS